MNAKLSPQMTAALRHIEANLNSAGWCVRFYGHSTNTLAALVRRGLVEANPEAGGQLRPVATEIPAATPEPQYVTADGPESSGIRWHLMDADGNPVTAGEHRAMWSGQPRFTIAERPEVQSWDGEVPLNIWVTWADDTRGYCRADQLVSGWNWELEVAAA
jgi:hypothetical protein